MSESIMNTYNTLFYQIVNVLFQSHGRLEYERAFTYLTADQSGTVQFPTAGEMVMKPKLAGAFASLQDPQYNRVLTTLSDYECVSGSVWLQMDKVNFDPLIVQAEQAMWAARRLIDQTIINTLLADGDILYLDVGSPAEGFTYQKAIASVQYFGNEAIPVGDGNKWCMIAPSAQADILNQTEFTNAFFLERGAVKSTLLPGDSALDMKFVIIPNMIEGGLPTITNDDDSITRYNYAWHRQAVGLALGQSGIRTRITQENLVGEFIIRVEMSIGASVIQPIGVLGIQTLENETYFPFSPPSLTLQQNARNALAGKSNRPVVRRSRSSAAVATALNTGPSSSPKVIAKGA